MDDPGHDEWMPKRGEVWVNTKSGQEWIIAGDPILGKLGQVLCDCPSRGKSSMWYLHTFKNGRMSRTGRIV
jgi:hypothetical protein